VGRKKVRRREQTRSGNGREGKEGEEEDGTLEESEKSP